jgi:adenylosuccinate synthase
MGIGETQSDANQGLALRVGDLFNEGKTYNLLEGLRVRALEKTREIKLPFGMPVIEETCDSAKVGKFARGYRQFAKRHILTLQTQDLLGALRDQTVVFEGAQGVLLDENFGFHPYTTWSRTTTENADALLDEVGITNVERIGVLRPYQTRHGPGPLPTYDQRLTLDLPDPHNVFGEWQREFRLGWLDLTLLEYAVSAASINQLNCLAMTNLDTWIGSTQRPRVSHQYKDPQKLYPPIPMPYSLRDQESLCQILMKAEPEYQMLPSDQWDAIGPVVSERVKVPIRYLSTGPTYQSKVDLQ